MCAPLESRDHNLLQIDSRLGQHRRPCTLSTRAVATWSSSRSPVVSCTAMARSPKYLARRWRPSRARSWLSSRSGGRRSSSSSCRAGRTRTRLLTRVRLSQCRRHNLRPHKRAGIDLDKDTMAQVYEKFGLEPGTQDFIGHAMALYFDDE